MKSRDEGPCYACGKLSLYLERDHRVPPRLGGSRRHFNLQDLCLDCHRRKSIIEVDLMSLNAESDDVKEWFHLAFQSKPELVKHFIDNIALRVGHFREVYGKLLDEQS